jgi:hypothetical protein
MNPNVRTVTDLTTIPLSVAQAGTLTPFAGDVLLLEYSGTAAALDAILVQAGANKEQQKTSLWVWDGTSTAPFNITAWFGKFIKVDRDASAYTGDFNLIDSKLFGWEVISTGDGTGTVSGSAIGALNTISFKPITDFFIDPVVVEGNAGDNLTVLEFYNLQSNSSSNVNGVVATNIVFSQLETLISTSQLIAGSWYKITDFQTAHYIQFSDSIGDEEIHTGAIEPMLVQAVSSSELATEIWSTVYPTDKITWKPIFNDRDYDAVLGQSTGVITSRYDTLLKLYRDYDWRNVIFRRWETVSGSGDYNNYTDTGFAFQDFPPFYLILDNFDTFDVSVGSGLEGGQSNLGLPYQLDNVVFQSQCAVSKVSVGATSTFQEIFTVNNIDILIDQLCQYEFTNNNIKYVLSNQFDGEVRDNTLMELAENVISGVFFDNIGASFVENNIDGQVSSNNLVEVAENIISGGFFNNIGTIFLENNIDGNFINNNFSFLYQNVVTGDIKENLFMANIQSKTYTSTAGMQAGSPSVTLLDAVDGDVEQILSGGVLSYVTF